MLRAFTEALGISVYSLSREWGAAIRDRYAPQLRERTKPSDIGQPVIQDPANISPEISPDGRYVAIFPQQDPFTIDDAIGGQNTRGDIWVEY